MLKEKIRTGIKELDNALNGGLPKGATILLTGQCGTGKTTLAIEFLVNGALRDEKGLFISVTEPTSKLLDNMRSYEFFDETLVDDEKMFFLDVVNLAIKLGLPPTDQTYEEIIVLVNAIGNIVKELDIKRCVIDSVTGLCYQLNNRSKIRDLIFTLGKMLADLEVTTLLISELHTGSGEFSTYGVEEAIADGIIKLGNLERRGDLLRTLQIIKMRGATHSRAMYVMDLTPNGIILAPLLKWGSISTKGPV